MVIKNQKGQTMVEYILLLAVVMSLVTTFYNSQLFKRLFGSQGSVGAKIKTETEFGYQHAFIGGRQTGSMDDYPGATHPSYYDEKTGSTRFFGPKDPYQ